MFESNVKETYWLLDGSLVTDNFFGFEMVSDNVTVTQDSVVIGFNCGAPPEPAVSVCVGVCRVGWGNGDGEMGWGNGSGDRGGEMGVGLGKCGVVDMGSMTVCP